MVFDICIYIFGWICLDFIFGLLLVAKFCELNFWTHNQASEIENEKIPNSENFCKSVSGRMFFCWLLLGVCVLCGGGEDFLVAHCENHREQFRTNSWMRKRHTYMCINIITGTVALHSWAGCWRKHNSSRAPLSHGCGPKTQKRSV